MTPSRERSARPASDYAPEEPLFQLKPLPQPRLSEEEFLAWCTGETRAEWRNREVIRLLFVARTNAHRLRPGSLDGPPDLVIEIVSPDSVERDWRQKYADYEAAGITEYWIVDPLQEVLQPYRLSAAGRHEPIAPRNGLYHSTVAPGFALDPAWLWQDPLPDEVAILRRLGAL